MAGKVKMQLEPKWGLSSSPSPYCINNTKSMNIIGRDECFGHFITNTQFGS